MSNKYGSVKIVAKNIIYSIFFTGLAYLIPIVYTPYLYLKIGAKLLGNVTVIVTIFTFLSFITDYSSNIIYVRKIASDRINTLKYLHEIFSVKILLFAIIIIVTFIIVFSFPKLRNNFYLYLFALGIVLGRVLLPNAYFLATEQIKILSSSYFLSQILYCLLIFIFIDDSADYKKVIILLALSNITTALLMLVIVIKKENIAFFSFITLERLLYILKRDFNIFISQVASSGFIYINVIILGLFATPINVANYTVAEKIIIIFKQGIGAIGSVVYPRLCSLISINLLDGVVFVTKIFNLLRIGAFIISLCLLFLAKTILYYLSINSLEAIQILQILSFIPFILTYNVPSFLILNANKKEKIASNIINVAMTINILIGFILSYIWSSFGIAFSAIITELFLSITFTIFVKKKLINKTIDSK